MAAFTYKRRAVSRGEYNSKNIGQKSFNSVWGEESKMATQASPPPPKWPAMTRYRYVSRVQRRVKRGVTRHFSIYSLIKSYFKKLISHNRSTKLAPSLLRCQSLPNSFLRAVRRENVSYIVTRAHKRPAKTAHHSQSATLHSTFYRQHLCGRQWTQEQSRPQQHTWNSKFFDIFHAEGLLHTVYIFNIFLWIEVIDSRHIAKEAFR